MFNCYNKLSFQNFLEKLLNVIDMLLIYSYNRATVHCGLLALLDGQIYLVRISRSSIQQPFLRLGMFLHPIHSLGLIWSCISKITQFYSLEGPKNLKKHFQSSLRLSYKIAVAIATGEEC